MKNFIRNYRIVVRKFSQSTPVFAMPQPDYGPMEVQRSTLLNGMKVAAARHLGAQISACTIMFQAGSRYECGDNLGATHFLRAISSATGQGYSGYSKMRVLQQNGAYLTCSSDRQNVAFTLRCPLPVFCELKYFLLDTAARYCYNDWDIDDRKTLVREDLYRVHPEQRVIDLVQRALWRGPLGNSMFCEEERIEEMTKERLYCYAQTNFLSNCCSVASVGVPFDETMKLADKIAPVGKDSPPHRCPMHSYPRNGFEYFDMGRNHDTWICAAIPGCGSRELANLLKHALVAAACGTGNVMRGQHELDRTPQPPLGLMAADPYTEYKAFNISYLDSGTFGVVAKTRACSATQVACSVIEFLTNVGDLDFQQLEVGKKRLKLSLLLHDENCTKVSEGLALQLASGAQLDNACQACCMIDKIYPDEISITAKSLSAKRCQMAVAVVGDVGAVPHDMELLRVS